MRLVSMHGHNETRGGERMGGRKKEWKRGREEEEGRGRKGEERESTNLLCTNGNVAPSLQCPHKYVSIHVRSRNCETINTRTKSHVISARSLLSNNFCCKSYKIPNLHKVCNAHFTHYKSESPHSTDSLLAVVVVRKNCLACAWHMRTYLKSWDPFIFPACEQHMPGMQGRE